MGDFSLEPLLILNSLPYVGPLRGRFLLNRYGSAEAVLQAPLEEIASLPGFGEKIIESWKKWMRQEPWKEDLRLAREMGAALVSYTDPSYPKRLATLDDAPLILYRYGDYTDADNTSLAIVGTRIASLYGLEMAKMFGARLAHEGVTVVSGLARGVDTAAHHGALEKGRTIAVLGSGLKSIYPRENTALAEAIAKRGCLLSEFPMATPPDKHHFPRRNRLVSGMTMGTLLIEAPEKSGAMLTADNALNQGRPLFVLPGRADLSGCRGNLRLLQSGKARLVVEPKEVLESLGVKQKIIAPGSIPSLSEEERGLLSLFPEGEVSVEGLVDLSGHPIAKLSGLLMRLVLKRVIKEYPGKLYKVCDLT